MIEWKQSPVKVHRNQFKLLGTSYNYLNDHHSLHKRIPEGESRLMAVCKVEDEGRLCYKLDYKQRLLKHNVSLLDDRQYMRLGHQRRRNKTGGVFVVYVPEWFRKDCCIESRKNIKSGKDYFFTEVQVRDDGIYLYPV